MNWVEDKQAEKGPITAGTASMTAFDIEGFQLAQIFDVPLDQIEQNTKYLDDVKAWAASQVDPEVPLTYLDIARGERLKMGNNNSLKEFWAYLQLQKEQQRLTERIEAFRNG